MLKDFEFSYSVNEEERTLYFYYIIKKNMGTKIKIKLPDYIKDTSQILSSLIPYYGREIEDFDTVCLDLLDKLPGNLHMYPEITILYNMSNKDVLGSVDLDNLDDYNGDMLRIFNGKLDNYTDYKHRIVIRTYEDMDKKSKYSALVMRSGDKCDFIPSLYEDESKSPYVLFAREFVDKLDAIRTKRVFKGKRKVRTKKDA